MAGIKIDGRLSFSFDVSPEQFMVLTGPDQEAAKKLLAELIQAEPCRVSEICQVVGESRYSLPGLLDVPVYSPEHRYAIAKIVAIEDFKNELDCLGYSVEDFSEEELASMFEEFERNLYDNATYNAIYSDVADDVARKQEAINLRATAEAEYDERDVAQPGYGDFPTLDEIKRDYRELMDIIKDVRTIEQAREVEANYGISVEINGVSIDEFVNGLKTVNGRSGSRGTNADIEWIRYEAFGCLSYVYDRFDSKPTFDVWGNAAYCEFVTDIHIDDLTPENYAVWVNNEVERLNEQGVKLSGDVDGLLLDAVIRAAENRNSVPLDSRGNVDFSKDDMGIVARS